MPDPMEDHKRSAAEEDADNQLVDREAIKVVLRNRLRGPLSTYYDSWASEYVAGLSRESLLDQAAKEILRMLGIEDRPRPLDLLSELRGIVAFMDDHLDGDSVAPAYREQPLAQDWARVSKLAEEVGEAVDALIGVTGQNPRKGQYGTYDDLLSELADVSLTALYAIRHFVVDDPSAPTAVDLLIARARYHRDRIVHLEEST